MRYPQFEEKIKQNIVAPAMAQGSPSTYGIILDYKTTNNTATVLISHPGSDEPGEVFYNVPCPMITGVQSQAPLPGQPCWVVFKDNKITFPLVVSYFSHIYEEVNYDNQYVAKNNTPRFMYSM